MRYLLAMIVAMVFALLATLFVSSPLASFAVRQFSFDNPDTVADLHSFVFMAANVAALLLGWSIGWALGGRFVRETHVE